MDQSSKRSRNPTSTPDKLTEKPSDKSVKLDICSKCNEVVTEDCIECYWCSQWVHRACANFEENDLITLSSASQNILFFCSSCLSVLPDALRYFKLQTQIVNELQTGFQSVENNLRKEIVNQITKCFEPINTVQLDTTCKNLRKSIDEVSTKINELSSHNSNLQMEIETTSESLGAPVQPKSLVYSASSNAALSIADELADRERRKRNVIIYNFPEAPDREADKASFISLCKSVYKCEFDINKIMRLGKKVTDKTRPLLLCLDHEEDKNLILSRSYLLHRNSQYSKVFVTPDRTKFEREKHKKLVNELKERRSQGENDLVIRNGIIVVKQSRPTNRSSNQKPETPIQSS